MEIKNIEELRESLKNCKVSIFDIDGTLVNSEITHFKAWNDIIKKYTGKDATSDQISRYISNDDYNICRMIKSDFKIDFNDDDIIKERRLRFLEYLKEYSLPKNNLLYSILKEESFCPYNRYIVTSQDINIANKELLNIGLSKDFNACHFNVKNKKDSYIIIKETCKVDKNIYSGFVLFEDSPRYIDIALNLGFDVVCVIHDLNRYRMENYIKRKYDREKLDLKWMNL